MVMSSPMNLTSRFSDALSAAVEIHQGQTRKGTAVPYVEHVLGVASIAMFHGADEDEAIAALLHDAIEDAPAALGASGARRLIHDLFGARVLEIVEGCTDADVVPKPEWRERKEKYIAHVASQSSSVILVSASDKRHNAGEILADYREIGDALWQRFNTTAGKAGVIGYYRGLTTAYRTTGYHVKLVNELDAVVSQLEAAAGLRGVWPLIQS